MEWLVKKYEELTKDELYNIIKERVDVFVVEQQCPYPEIDGRDKESYHFFALDKDNIIVYLRILEPGISFKEASIGRVLVNKIYRRQGIGKEIIKRAIDFITNKLGYNIIRISAQEYLLDFYTELGFSKVSDVYLEDGIPHIEMVFENIK